MTVYFAPFTFNFSTSQILVDGGTVTLTAAGIYTAVKQAQETEEGIIYPRIATGTGLNALSPGVQVGLTVELLGNWQLKFPDGNYTAIVRDGNLIGGPLADPIAYSNGVQIVLIQSAAAVVTTATTADPWLTPLPGAYPTGSAGAILGLDVPATKNLAGLIPATL